MAKRFQVVNLDDIMMSSLHTISILNDLPSDTEENRKAIDNLIMTTYEVTDTLSIIPTCQCGKTTMGINLGKVCKVCNTPVERPVETPITANVWMRVPDGVAGFIAPIAWLMFDTLLSSNNYNLMEWVTNPLSKPPKNASRTVLEKIGVFEAAGWKRGLNSFIMNFDQFLDIVSTLKLPLGEKVIAFMRANRTAIFPRHLPVPTKALLVLEKTNVGAFADLPITGAVDAARTLVAVSKHDMYFSPNYLERKVVSIIDNMSTYLWTTIKDNFNGKRGWLRSQLFRSRSHWCMRGVITSITAPHHYEEIHIPWAQGLEMLKYHIVSKLTHMGWCETAAYSLVEASGKVYVPILDQVMQELINETEWRGIPCLFQRNPTLVRGSMQCLFITKVKTNIEDYTISFSCLCTKAPNAD